MPDTRFTGPDILIPFSEMLKSVSFVSFVSFDQKTVQDRIWAGLTVTAQRVF